MLPGGPGAHAAAGTWSPGTGRPLPGGVLRTAARGSGRLGWTPSGPAPALGAGASSVPATAVLPMGGRHLGQRVRCEPGMARWCSVCLGVAREARGPQGSGRGPSAGQGRLLLHHPTTGVPWLAFLLPSLSAGFNLNFPSPGGKRLLNEVPKEPAGRQATAALGTPGPWEGGPQSQGQLPGPAGAAGSGQRKGKATTGAPTHPGCAHRGALGSPGAWSSLPPRPAMGVRLPIRRVRGEAPGSQLLIAAPSHPLHGTPAQLSGSSEKTPGLPEPGHLPRRSGSSTRLAGGSAREVNSGLEPRSPPRHMFIHWLTVVPLPPVEHLTCAPGWDTPGTRARQDLQH